MANLGTATNGKEGVQQPLLKYHHRTVYEGFSTHTMTSCALPSRICRYLGFSAILLFIGLSHPFMKIPFDIWEHLMRIASIYDTGESFIFSPEDKAPNMNLWH